MSERVNLQQVSESTYAMVDQRLVGNVGAVVFSDFMVVIDTGKNPPLARILRDTLQEQFRLPVRYVVVTHNHLDHTAGLSAFTDVAIVGSRMLMDAAKEMLVLPSLVFDDQVVISGDKALGLRYCGGHTDCSIYGYVAVEKVLFSGDLVVVGEFPFAGDMTVDPEVWMSTLKSWMSMDIEHVIPGHGPVTGPEAFGKQLEFLEALKDNTIAAIKAGKDHTQVVVPDMVPVGEGHGWFVDRTLERWHAYYSGR